MNYYKSDLAYIHDDGFGQFAKAAAHTLVAELQSNQLLEGTVLDLGCGSGTAAQIFSNYGYQVIGLDISKDFIRIARERVPEGTFHVRSFVGTELPACVGVCAIGEVLNYKFDEESNDITRRKLFENVFSALRPGGLFLFDIAGPDRTPEDKKRSFIEHQDWTVLTEVSAEGKILTRKITTFIRVGELYRRRKETHQLQLISPNSIKRQLESCGFFVKRIREYEETPLLSGLHGFKAFKTLQAV
ncbi:methyltransferase domain-containing protein [Aliifodinibius sp. S!AR15-10]|uniref:class I SAM-dependent DNA methyltransferase n=1 Tax=Aliifodinibius sp. S!AR15-10 TaxID=2950437 RepID=UPI00285AF829|nr:class I SAM-dependent methyltransferase [Aliifodinibius sp. S!AR15-10]MDR8394620.1 methyltransferase domain-containing protein [Aliifodinibius sp. S!AR15-10]